MPKATGGPSESAQVLIEALHAQREISYVRANIERLPWNPRHLDDGITCSAHSCQVLMVCIWALA